VARTIAILGATSTVAQALAAEFAARGHGLVLAGRDLPAVQAIAAGIRERFAVPASALAFEALAFETHAGFWEECRQAAGEPLAGLIIVFGYLGDGEQARQDWPEARRILDTNFTAAVSILDRAAPVFEAQRAGFICVITSVAGDRGHQASYHYGAAKGGLNVYLQGLRDRLSAAGVRVITIKPGYIDTKMIRGRPGVLQGLAVSPEYAGRKIARAILRGRAVAYVPWYWRWIMFAARLAPGALFRRFHR